MNLLLFTLRMTAKAKWNHKFPAFLSNFSIGSARLLQPQEGMVVANGRDVQKLKRQKIAQDMAYVSQQNEGAQFTVYDSVLLGRKPYIKVNPSVEDHRITKNILERMGLEAFSIRYLDELSGGEL